MAHNFAPTFLEDVPLDTLDERDSLRHKPLADDIVATVLSCPTPFSLALASDWGGGKTTVVNHVCNQLRGDQTAAVVCFDAWKYQRDSLRRQFLREVHIQLTKQKILSTSDLTTGRLYDRTTVQEPPRIDWSTVRPWHADRDDRPTAWIRFVVFCLGALLLVTAFVLAALDVLPFALVTSILGASFLSSAASILPRVLKTESRAVTREPLTSAEEFEDQFVRWLDNPNLRSRRLVVVVDNLDRCPGDQVVEMLGDIKTFLEPASRQVIFILPIDETAVRRAVASRYKSEDFAVEFLRKFFNTVFRIPPPLWAETRRFADAKLRETGLLEASGADEAEAASVVAVILATYVNNPRRIIQFLNRLLAQWLELSATARELRKPQITADLAALAKCVALRDRWPDTALMLERDPMLFNLIQEHAAASQAPELGIRGLEVIETDADGEHAILGLASFFRATQQVRVERPRLMFTAKADIFEVTLPDADLLRQYLVGAVEHDLRTLLGDSEQWQTQSVRTAAASLIQQDVRDRISVNPHDPSVAETIRAVAPVLDLFVLRSKDELLTLFFRLLKQGTILDRLATLEPATGVRLARAAPPAFQQEADALLAAVIRAAPPNAKPALTRLMSDAASELAHARSALLAEPTISGDPLVLYPLVQHDDQPTEFWSDEVVLRCCQSAVASDRIVDELDPVKNMITIAAHRQLPVADLVFSILEHPSLVASTELLEWAATEPVLDTEGHDDRDVSAILAALESQAASGLLPQHACLALLARLHRHADHTGRDQIEMAFRPFFITVPNTDLAPLCEPSFPLLTSLAPNLSSLLFIETTAEPSVDELATRIKVAQRHLGGWPPVADALLQVIRNPSLRPRLPSFTHALRAVAPQTPPELIDAVWEPAVDLLSSTRPYSTEIAAMLNDLWVRLARKDARTRRANRDRLRQALLSAILSSQPQALTDYETAAFPQNDRDSDIASALSAIERGTVPDCTVAVAFMTKPGTRLRDRVFDQLVTLATDDLFWPPAADALTRIDWLPSERCWQRGLTLLTTAAITTRQSNPARAAQLFRVATRLVASGADSDSTRASLVQTAKALRMESLLADDEYQEILGRYAPDDVQSPAPG